ncbi:hypothetical protein ZHAS_00001467 [Anopheles sinensis]|uniref:Protein kinase domain-containing protein n=1 Tax=Anopheles sinensis TaxID=74873 RepID=A0A084VBD3_ANOSI|nr:hypothetical protein ZHAS_00001467 [Anopheles sinensis]
MFHRPFDAPTRQTLSLLVQQGHFMIPYYVSFECEILLKKCLVKKPSKRATLEAIMRDTWVNIGYQGKELRPYVEPSLELQAPNFELSLDTKSELSSSDSLIFGLTTAIVAASVVATLLFCSKK